MMRTYLITIIMPDGSLGQYQGIYTNDWEAIKAMLDTFYDARGISLRSLP